MLNSKREKYANDVEYQKRGRSQIPTTAREKTKFRLTQKAMGKKNITTSDLRHSERVVCDLTLLIKKSTFGEMIRKDAYLTK